MYIVKIIVQYKDIIIILNSMFKNLRIDWIYSKVLIKEPLLKIIDTQVELNVENHVI